MAEYRAIQVAIADADPPFPCVVQLDEHGRIPRWNGWVAAPLFDRATVEAIAKAWDGVEYFDQVEFDGDVAVVSSGMWEPDRVEPMLVDGVQRWAIGANGYCWEEYE